MLIQMTEEEGKLYRAWIKYLGGSNPSNRTEAFFNARANRQVPWSISPSLCSSETKIGVNGFLSRSTKKD